jgi:hypothetical protein
VKEDLMVLAGRCAPHQIWVGIRSRITRLEVLVACMGEIRIAYRISGNCNCNVNVVVILR